MVACLRGVTVHCDSVEAVTSVLDGIPNTIVGSVRCVLPLLDCCLHPSVVALTSCGLGNDPPGRGSPFPAPRAFSRQKLGATGEGLWSRDREAVNKSASCTAIDFGHTDLCRLAIQTCYVVPVLEQATLLPLRVRSRCPLQQRVRDPNS